MANRGLLLNTDRRCDAPCDLESMRRQSSSIHIAESANRIPVPWLACFRSEDLRATRCRLMTGPDAFEIIELMLPCASVVSARSALESQRPLFDALIGDTAVAESYWSAALNGLSELPLANLAMDPVEVLLLNDLDEEAATLEQCIRGNNKELDLVRRLSFFEQGFGVYSFDEFMNAPPESLDHDARKGNSAALLFGRIAREYWVQPSQSTREPAKNSTLTISRTSKPWWRFW